MTPRLATGAACLALAALLAPPAQAITYDERTVQIFHQKISLCGEAVPKGGGRDGTAGCFQPLPAELYDGTKIVAEAPADFNQAYTAWQKYKAHFESCVKKWNGSKYMQGHADGAFFKETLEQRAAYVNTVLAAIKEAEPRVKQNEATCKEFTATVMTDDATWAIKVLLGKQSILKRQFAEKIGVVRQLSDTVAGHCANPKYKDVGHTYCYGRLSMNRIVPETSPKVWCETVATRDEWFRKQVDDTVAAALTDYELPFKVEKSGNVWTTKAFYLKDLELTEKRQSELVAEFDALYTSAGVEFQPSKELFAPLEARFEEARRFIQEGAPAWTPTKTKTGVAGYGKKLGKAAVKDRYPEARLGQVWMSSKAWDIHKNKLDIPTYRKAYGHILYQIPGEPWCRDGQFIIAEDYAGGGKYEKDGETFIEVEQFKPCK